MKQRLLILYLFILSLKSFCQISAKDYNVLKKSIPEESTVLITNSDFFLAGEYIYYKTILCEKEQFSNISKLVYVELIGKDHNPVFKHKLKVKNSSVNGDFFIPSSIKTGHYKLVSYTHWSQNNTKDNYSEKDMFIINPFSTESKSYEEINTKKVVQIAKNDSVVYPKTIDADFAALQLNQSSYSSREKVSMEIQLNETDNSIHTLSVRKVDSIVISNYPEERRINNTSTTRFLPELRGEIISGYLESNNDVPVDNIDISLSFAGKNPIVKNAVTNSNGQFYFILNSNYGNKLLNVQVLNKDKDHYKITLQAKQFNFLNQLEFHDVTLESNLKKWLEQESVNHQIENAYFAVKADSIMVNDLNKDFYNSIETIFNLDDYTRFKTIRETFVEIVNTASLTKHDTTYVFNVPDLVNINYNRDLNYLTPLILVDGILIQDNLDIVNYDVASIESISTVTGQYIYGNTLYNGVISFKTYDGDFDNVAHDYFKKIDYASIQPSKLYYEPNYENNQTLKRIPDYRKQLLWVPNLGLKERTTISFFTSDNKGLYQVLLKSVTPNGETKTVSKYFTVN